MSGPHRETDENDQPRLDYYVEECQRLQRQYEAALEGKDAATARAERAEADQRILRAIHAAAALPGNADLLRALRDLGCDQPAGDPVAMRFIDDRPTPDDRKGVDGEAAILPRHCERCPSSTVQCAECREHDEMGK